MSDQEDDFIVDILPQGDLTLDGNYAKLPLIAIFDEWEAYKNFCNWCIRHGVEINETPEMTRKRIEEAGEHRE